MLIVMSTGATKEMVTQVKKLGPNPLAGGGLYKKEKLESELISEVAVPS